MQLTLFILLIIPKIENSYKMLKHNLYRMDVCNRNLYFLTSKLGRIIPKP